MNTGIYKLSFSNGSIYVGQSVDMLARISQHKKSVYSGSAASKLQHAFDTYGDFDVDVLCLCSRDFLDILEAYYIKVLSPSLNTSLPESSLAKYSSERIEMIYSMRDNTLPQLALYANVCKEQIPLLEASIVTLKVARSEEEILADASKRIVAAESSAVKNLAEVERLKGRGFWSRVFNR